MVSAIPAASTPAAASYASGRMHMQPPLPDQSQAAPSSHVALQKQKGAHKRKAPESSRRLSASDTTATTHAVQQQSDLPGRSPTQQDASLLPALLSGMLANEALHPSGAEMPTVPANVGAQQAAVVVPTGRPVAVGSAGQPSWSTVDQRAGQQYIQQRYAADPGSAASKEVSQAAGLGSDKVLGSLQARDHNQPSQRESPNQHAELDAGPGLAAQSMAAPERPKPSPLLQPHKKKKKKSIEELKPPPAAKSWQDWLK